MVSAALKRIQATSRKRIGINRLSVGNKFKNGAKNCCIFPGRVPSTTIPRKGITSVKPKVSLIAVSRLIISTKRILYRKGKIIE
jgi:hypothetical protein